jgi:two-component system invasion response regulator UvrY
MEGINTILLVDDHSIIRLGTSILIREMIPGAAIWQSSTFEEAVDVTNNEKPDLILLDIEIPGGGNIDMINVLKLRHAKAKILMFTCYDEQIFGLRYIHAGADGFLSKHASSDVFKYAISKILNNEKYISERLKEQYINELINEKELKSNPLKKLSNRELEVAGLLIKGVSTAEIALSLNLQLSTVSTYKTRIFEKLKVHNIIDLATKVKLYQKV